MEIPGTCNFMTTGPTNPQLRELISELKSKGFKDDSSFWLRIANDLEKPTRQRRIVNLSKINRFTKKGDIIIVPGKVLAAGDLGHSVTIAAYQFSEEAIGKLKQAKATHLTIPQLMKQYPNGKEVRIFG